MEYAAGVIIAIAVGLWASLIGYDKERSFYSTALTVIACYYLLFAAMAKSTDALVAEALPVLLFAGAAALGFRRTPWIVVAGLALHGVFDLFHHAVIDNPGVPAWWPGFCLGYDVTAAAYLAFLLVFRRPANEPSASMQSLELKAPPVPLAVVFAAAMYGASSVTPAATFVIPGRLGIAIGLALLGLTMAIAGVVAFRAHKTTVNPLNPGASSSVVSAGVYRFSRNPMYLGFLLALAAWAIYLSNAIAALFLPAFVAYINQFQIKPEERALLAKFGPAYSQYMAAVRRWV